MTRCAASIPGQRAWRKFRREAACVPVLITGAGLGFGRALVSVYAAREWVVFPLVRDEPTARRLKDKVGGSA